MTMAACPTCGYEKLIRYLVGMTKTSDIEHEFLCPRCETTGLILYLLPCNTGPQDGYKSFRYELDKDRTRFDIFMKRFKRVGFEYKRPGIEQVDEPVIEEVDCVAIGEELNCVTVEEEL